ncbi:hypothetical protein Trydic_g14769 [Trypoxylus dichotomus]
MDIAFHDFFMLPKYKNVCKTTRTAKSTCIYVRKILEQKQLSSTSQCILENDRARSSSCETKESTAHRGSLVHLANLQFTCHLRLKVHNTPLKRDMFDLTPCLCAAKLVFPHVYAIEFS